MSISSAVETHSSLHRLRALEGANLAEKVSTGGNQLFQWFEAFKNRSENWVMERAMMHHIKTSFASVDSEAGAEALLRKFRSLQSSGDLSGLDTGKLITVEMSPADGQTMMELRTSQTTTNKAHMARPKGRVLLYAIGGGFILPPAPRQITLVGELADAIGCAPVIARHRLAPEAPFPEPINDIADQYETLLETGHAPEDIVFGGAMAGATLILSTALTLRERGLPQPAGILLFSPWGDLSLSGWSYITRSATTASPFRMETAAFCARLYLQKELSTHPLASPVFADLTGLPPIAIHTSKHDMHFDDALKLVENADDAGVEAHIRYWDSPNHHLERFNRREKQKSFELARQFVESLSEID